MSTPENFDTYATRASIFLRLRADETRPRELAWGEFRQRYAPVIAGFARNMGARQQDIDDLIQDVMTGFFEAAPSFVYDPAKGRFRGFLKVCTFRALRKKLGRNARFKSTPLDEVDPESLEIEKAWSAPWDQQMLQLAVEAARAQYRGRKSFRAFEMNVLQGKPAAEVAKELRMTVENVYKCKERLTETLRQKVKEFQDRYG